MFKELTVESIYQSQSQPRYSRIVEEFKARFGDKPAFIVRAPGRVNLIGEHIDYEGYGVLPFAIEKDCIIAVGLSEASTVQIQHMNSEEYPPHAISVDVRETPKYSNVYIRYFYAGYEAALREASSLKNVPPELLQKLTKFQFQGMKILVEGNVPTGSGLSSSSSFCVCSALATLRANNLHNHISKEQFITQVIKYERLVGTAIGGMDQSISVLGQRDSALFIEFNPIRSTVVELPKNYRFVIINSLQESKKIETVGERYNKRVCQCYMAVKLLAQKLGIEKQASQTMKTFRDLQEHCGLPLQDMILLVEEYLEPRQFSRKELEEVFGPLDSLLKQIPNYQAVLQIDQTFSLYNAAKHVYSEAYRVIQFINVCSSNLNPNSKAIILGKLMNESQQSCRDTYKCSSTLLDTVTDLALKEGAVGSRLTGAGWGGCSVSMVEETKVAGFIAAIKEKYFRREELRPKVQKEGIDNLIFQTVSVDGACFVSLGKQ